ncbi:MAG: hypothetical protein ACI8S6_001329 [Myxococcota bacterium]|jgi:hypothetical protein
MMAAIMLALLSGCAPEPPPDPRRQDQLLYQQALQSSDPRAAVALCEQISDLPTRGECVVFEAGELLKAGGDGYGACDRLEHTGWQAVCFFEMVDAGKLRGEPALRACRRAGAFLERCLAHALQREENILARRYPAGTEAELQAHIVGLLRPYGLAESSEESLDVTITGRIVAERFRRSYGQQPFTRTACGTADDAACAEAYRVVVIRAGGQGRAPSDCTLPMSRDRISALSLPVWTDDTQDIADVVWAHQCRRANGRHNQPPDVRSAERAKQPGG